MDIAVKNNSKRLVGLDGLKGQVTLLPGINKMSQADVEHVMKHPTVKAKVEAGDLEFLLPEKEEEKTASPVEALVKLKAKEAIETAKGSADAELLQEWFAKETRASVKEAIEKQLEELSAPAEHRSDS